MSAISQRIAWLMATAIAALAVNSVTLTYGSIGTTYDEPAHIYTGMEWWLTGKYTIEPLHPPLARAAVAAPLYLSGIVPPAVKQLQSEGGATPEAVEKTLRHLTWDSSHQLLYEGGEIYHRLSLARMGVLPFYLLSLCIVFAWARRLFGNGAALISLLLYALLPTPAAHAGVATTDMPYAALCVATLYLFSRWLEQPARNTGLLLGFSGALTLAAKFSALMHLPAAMLAMAAWHAYTHKNIQWKSYARALPWVIAIGLFTVAAAYRFDPVQPIMDGIGQVMAKNARGHANVFMGELHPYGHWLYFPVVWFFKTPIAFLICLPLAWLALRGRGSAAWQPLLAAAAILAVSMASQINIGVRHILPVDALLAITAGGGVTWLAQRYKKPLGAMAAAALVLSQTYDFAAAYPDRISYFNALAGDNPSIIASDSNFDWGQDNLRLLYMLHKHKVESIALCMPFAIKDIYPLLHQEFTLLPCPDAPQPGWIAVTNDTVMLKAENKSLDWLKMHKPAENIGRTAKLYYISE